MAARQVAPSVKCGNFRRLDATAPCGHGSVTACKHTTLILSHDRREWFAEYANFRNLALAGRYDETIVPNDIAPTLATIAGYSDTKRFIGAGFSGDVEPLTCLFQIEKHE